MTEHVRALIVGTGFSGQAASITLQELGVEHTILATPRGSTMRPKIQLRGSTPSSPVPAGIEASIGWHLAKITPVAVADFLGRPAPAWLTRGRGR